VPNSDSSRSRTVIGRQVRRLDTRQEIMRQTQPPALVVGRAAVEIDIEEKSPIRTKQSLKKGSQSGGCCWCWEPKAIRS